MMSFVRFSKITTFALCNRCILTGSFVRKTLFNISVKTCQWQKVSNFSSSIAVYATKRKSPSRFPFSMASSIVMPKGADSNLKEQVYDYFLILDFEATCEDGQLIQPQEIIEFPVLKINSKTLEVESTFHQYVQPRVHKELTPFCTKLTGIIQEMVDGQPHLEETMKKFHQWMLEEKLLEQDTQFLFVTCGDWDLMKMLPSQCKYFDLQVPKYMREWLNIKKAFCDVTSTYPKGMMTMLESLGIKHQGRHHSGIDDCRNIGNILIELLRRGYVAKVSRSR